MTIKLMPWIWLGLNLLYICDASNIESQVQSVLLSSPSFVTRVPLKDAQRLRTPFNRKARFSTANAKLNHSNQQSSHSQTEGLTPGDRIQSIKALPFVAESGVVTQPLTTSLLFPRLVVGAILYVFGALVYAFTRVTIAGRTRKGYESIGAAMAVVGHADLVPSGLNGKAMNFPPKDEFPTRAEVLRNIPEECFVKDTAKSLMYAFISTAMTVGCGVLAYLYIPMQLAYWPVWFSYAAVTGTIATGCWVIAHECGHNAFSDNKLLQDTVGYILHSLLLVPYFSWQRSHAVHHSRTNHLTEGETHVPYVKGETKGTMNLHLKSHIGEGPFAIVQLFAHLVFGWPAYLLTGATGGSSRGITNHFFPNVNTGPVELFPGSWKQKVWKSDIGVLAVVAGLCYWTAQAGFATVFALYFGPYLFVNVWLVLYTWLQHTDTDVPHLENSEWSYIKGAFLTIDRPYGAVFDFLHHRIGSTHVAHHVECAIPHYHAVKATEALKKCYPDLYLYDPTPIATAAFRVASKCVAVEPRGEGKDKVWTFTDKVEPRLSSAEVV